MPISGTKITQAQVDALATTANTYLLPLVNAYVTNSLFPMHDYDYQYWTYPQTPQPLYEFPPALNTVQAARNITGSITYGTGSYPASNQTIAIKVFPYKILAGRKNYCATGSYAQVTSNNTYPDTFKVDWTWSPGSGSTADGYIVARVPFGSGGGLSTASLAGEQNVPFDYTDVPTAAFEDATFPNPLYSIPNPMSWNSTINRIRADFFAIMNMTSSLFTSSILSGPWIVGVNDSVLYPSDGLYQSGIFNSQSLSVAGELLGTYGMSNGGGTIAPNPNYTVYKNVKFIYDLNDAFDGITISNGRRLDFGSTINTTPLITYSASLSGIWNAQVYWQVDYTGPGSAPSTPPSIYGFSVDANPGGVTWSIAGTTTTASWALIANVDVGILPGSSSYSFTASSSPPNYTITAGPYVCSRLTYTTNIDSHPLAVIHPTSNGMFISAPDMPDGNSDFILMYNGNTYYSTAFWKISNPTLNGCWLANSLPVPGVNNLLDQDLPNYNGRTSSDIFHSKPIAISPNLPDLGLFLDNPPSYSYSPTEPIFASSARQQALLRNGDETITIYVSGSVTSGSFFSGSHPVIVSIGPKYNLTEQSTQIQPAQWPAIRDNVQMPLTWGTWQNPLQSLDVFTTTFTSGSSGFFTFTVPTDCTGLSIKIRKQSPLNGNYRIYDGGDLQPVQSMSIYVSKTDFPDPNDPSTYDFKTENKEVVIPGDGGFGYLTTLLGGGFNYLITNNTTSSIGFDLLTEVDFGDVPLEPSFLPTTNENFSYVITDIEPGYTHFYTFASVWPTFFGLKPIPQNGYVIYKVSARRRSVQNASGISKTPPNGRELKITLGQNRLQYDKTYSFAPFYTDNSSIGAGNDSTGAGDDGSNSSEGAGGAGFPYSITIPSGSSWSGEIDVFWPVTFGNPLVWKCDEYVVVDAYACWQPIFFSTKYGFINYYINLDYNYVTNFNPTTFRYCSKFANFFQPEQTNFPDNYGQDVYGDPGATTVSWPVSTTIYNDLEQCLNLLT